MEKEKAGVVYQIIHQKLKEKVGKDGCLSRRSLFEVFCRIYRISKKYRYPVLKELETYGMIKVIDRDIIKVMGCENVLDSSKIYKGMRMF